MSEQKVAVPKDSIREALASPDFTAADRALRSIVVSLLGSPTGEAAFDTQARTTSAVEGPAALAARVKGAQSSLGGSAGAEYFGLAVNRLSPLSRMGPVPLRHFGRCAAGAAALLASIPRDLEIPGAEAMERAVIVLSRTVARLEEGRQAVKKEAGGAGLETVSPILEAITKLAVLVAYVSKEAIIDNRVPSIEEVDEYMPDEEKTRLKQLGEASVAAYRKAREEHVDTLARQHNASLAALKRVLDLPRAGEIIAEIDRAVKGSYLRVTTSRTFLSSWVAPLVLLLCILIGSAVWAPLVIPEAASRIPYFGKLNSKSEWQRWAVAGSSLVGALAITLWLALRESDTPLTTKAAAAHAYMCGDADVLALINKQVGIEKESGEDENADYYWPSADLVAGSVAELMGDGIGTPDADSLTKGIDFDDLPASGFAGAIGGEAEGEGEEDGSVVDEAVVQEWAQRLGVSLEVAEEAVSTYFGVYEIIRYIHSISMSETESKDENGAPRVFRIGSSVFAALSHTLECAAAKMDNDMVSAISQLLASVDAAIAAKYLVEEDDMGEGGEVVEGEEEGEEVDQQEGEAQTEEAEEAAEEEKAEQE